MKSKTSRHCLKRLSSLLLAVALCIGMMPGAFAAQENGYHDPAEHCRRPMTAPMSWM